MAVQAGCLDGGVVLFHVLLITALMTVLLHPCSGQINFHPTNQGCNSLPPECQCEETLVACNCMESQPDLNSTSLNNNSTSLNNSSTSSSSSSSLVLVPSMFALRQVVAVSGCPNVTVPSGAVSTSLVHRLLLVNLTRLTLEPRSLLLRQRQHLELALINVTVDNLPSGLFHMLRENRALATNNQTRRLEIPKVQLIVNNSRIGKLSRGVFGVARIHDLVIANSTIESVEGGFLDNVVEGSITIEGNRVTTVERDALVNRRSDTGPENLIMRDNIFQGVDTPFVAATTQFNILVTNNSFPALDGSPWQLEAREDVAIEDNTFVNVPPYGLALTAGARVSFADNRVDTIQTNAFTAIRPEVDSTLVLVSGNRFRSTEPGSLALPARLLSEAVIIRGNVFEQPCSCNTSKDIMTALGLNNLTLRQAIESNKLNQPWLSLSQCQLLDNDDFDYIQVSLFHTRNCIDPDLTTTVFLVCFACALIVLACCVIVAWRRLREKHLAPTHSSSAQPQYPDGDLSWSRVMPDKRMYRETEIHVMFQKADVLRGYSLDSDTEYTVRGYDNMEQVEECRKEKERKKNLAKDELQGSTNKMDTLSGENIEQTTTEENWKTKRRRIDESEESTESVGDFEVIASPPQNYELNAKKTTDRVKFEDENNQEFDTDKVSNSKD